MARATAENSCCLTKGKSMVRDSQFQSWVFSSRRVGQYWRSFPEVEQGTKTKRTEQPKAQGPTPLVKKRLQRLPQVFDVWQADFRPLPSWIEEKGERYQPWIVMVTSRTDDLILTQEMTGEPPSSALIWDTLAVAMERPASGDPHRPIELHVAQNERWDELSPHLEEIGITCVPTDELDQLDFVFDSLSKHLTKDERPGLLEMPGIKPEQVAGLYGAAADGLVESRVIGQLFPSVGDLPGRHRSLP